MKRLARSHPEFDLQSLGRLDAIKRHRRTDQPSADISPMEKSPKTSYDLCMKSFPAFYSRRNLRDKYGDPSDAGKEDERLVDTLNF